MSEDQDLFFKELKAGFLSEAGESLEEAQSLLLKLEKEPTCQASWNCLFRIAHNIKGSGKAVGFDDVSTVAHHAENLFNAFRNGQTPVTSRNLDVALESIDQLRHLISAHQSPHPVCFDPSALIAKIEEVLNRKEAPLEEEALESPLSELSKTLEKSNSLVKAQAVTSKDEFVRISMQKIDDLLNNLGEQIILQNSLDQARHNFENEKDNILRSINQLNKLTYDIQQTAMALRMVSLKSLIAKLERAIRDSSSKLGKKISFEAEGQEQELDKSIVELLSDPLVHMVRNSVDHGIENPEERLSSGKLETGTIHIKAYRSGGYFYMEISDDGKGLDKDKILSKALEKGLISSEQSTQLSDKEIFELIFENGFSTKDQVSEVSGRGVGMDVVKQAITQVKGTYQIHSEKGKGTRFLIRLPLTLAVFNGIVIRVGEIQYVIPNSDVIDVMKIESTNIRRLANGENIIQIREDIYSLVLLESELQINKIHKNLEIPKKGVIVTSKINNRSIAFAVDEIVTQQRIVFKNLSREISNLKGAVGATILGDGSVAVILELSRIAGEMRAAA